MHYFSPGGGAGEMLLTIDSPEQKDYSGSGEGETTK